MPRYEHRVFRVMVAWGGGDYYLAAMIQKMSGKMLTILENRVGSLLPLCQILKRISEIPLPKSSWKAYDWLSSNDKWKTTKIWAGEELALIEK